MRLLVHPESVAIVRLPPDYGIPRWSGGGPICSITRTETEMSVVCATTSIPDPPPGPIEGPFAAVVVDGVLEFSQVGLLLSLLRPMANGGVPVLTLSTFNTDWVLVEAAKVPTAAALWRAAGFRVDIPQARIYPGREDDE